MFLLNVFEGKRMIFLEQSLTIFVLLNVVYNVLRGCVVACVERVIMISYHTIST